MESPAVVFIVFNRPEQTRVSFAAIRERKPSRLFIVADGPRADHPRDFSKCREVREIVDAIDWACDVRQNYANFNLGCKLRVSSGLNWVFSHVDEAVILEDDCVPHASFFSFCQILLDYYRHDERVMEIGGCNCQFGQMRTKYSYYFSKYSHNWGWATWKRAWETFDADIQFWPSLKETGLWRFLCEPYEKRYWERIYDRIFQGDLHTCWDYQWQLAMWSQNGLTIVPNVNLVSNIGHGSDATHTFSEHDALAQLPTQEIREICHPPFVIRHKEADKYMFGHTMRQPISQRMIARAINVLKTV